LFELLFAGGFAGAVLLHGRLFAADELLSNQCCGAACCCAWVAALLASAAVLLLTRLAKTSLPCDWSAADLAGLGGAFCKDKAVAISDVTLCTEASCGTVWLASNQQGAGQS
jgi:hypothetical protein